MMAVHSYGACGSHQAQGGGFCLALSLDPSSPFPCFWTLSSFKGQNCGLFPTWGPSGRRVGVWMPPWGGLETWPLPQRDTPDH